jgi:CRP/FNR family transcriptional regulator, cyclic AMP receptor protein
VKEDAEIGTVADPGAVFGELSVLLDQPHTADVRALETSQFYVANATMLLTENTIAVLYVATVLAQRLKGANHALAQLKHQLQRGDRQNSQSYGGISRRRRCRPYLSRIIHTIHS